jgi:NAD(P)-dependent dehydrogenase (short-subunit alcohol dehydrogenase family)
MNAHTLGEIDARAFRETMEINVLGPLKVAEAFLPHLEAGMDPVLVMMSSTLGSIAKNQDGADYSYRASKAALNAVMRSLSIDLAEKGIAVFAMHPGWVKTDMGGEKAPLSVGESVSGIREVLSGLSLRDTGRFLRWDGNEEPW